MCHRADQEHVGDVDLTITIPNHLSKLIVWDGVC